MKKKKWIVVLVLVAVTVAVYLYIKKNGTPMLGTHTGPQLTVLPGGVSTAALDNVSRTLTQYAATSGKANKVS